MLVYDVNVMKSFDALDNWHEEFLKQVLRDALDSHFLLVLYNSVSAFWYVQLLHFYFLSLSCLTK